MMKNRKRKAAQVKALKNRTIKPASARLLRYASLLGVLRRAYEQASYGKGAQRHGQQNLPFNAQPMQVISSLLNSHHGMLFQAMKKIRESTVLPTSQATFELLGAINYLAGAIIYLEKDKGTGWRQTTGL